MSHIRTFAVAALIGAVFAAPAQAATVVVNATGQVADTQFGAFVANGRSYQTGRLTLEVQDGLPFELIGGDTIEFAISLDGIFGVPGSSEQFFGVNFEGSDDQEAAGASNVSSIKFENATGLPANPVDAGCGNCLSAIYFGGNAGPFSFAGLSGSMLVSLSSPYSVESVSISYQVSEPLNVVPEPASWAMMIAGFGLAGAAARRRLNLQPA